MNYVLSGVSKESLLKTVETQHGYIGKQVSIWSYFNDTSGYGSLYMKQRQRVLISGKLPSIIARAHVGQDLSIKDTNLSLAY